MTDADNNKSELKRITFNCNSVMFEKGKVIVHVGLLSLQLYYPYLLLTKAQFGIVCHTIILFRYADDWKWKWSFALLVFGFGFGFAWDHCENPNYVGGRWST